MVVIRKYSPTQPRDRRGRWTDGGVDVARDSAYAAKVAAEGAERPYFKGSMVTDLREPDGGFTFNPRTNKAANAGFAVSPYPERSRVIQNVNQLSDREVLGQINSYMSDNADLLSKDKHFLGGWHDPATGDAYLDVSIVESSSGAAYFTGKNHDQIAYFDLQSFESVDIDRNARSGQPG